MVLKEKVTYVTHKAMKNLFKILFSCVLLASLVVMPSTTTFALTHFAGGDGTENNPYLIETAEQFSAIRADLDAFYALISDIDLSDLTGRFDDLDPNYNNGEGWMPIGTRQASFEGVFDGRGFKISGLAIKKTTDSESMVMGLFGSTYGATLYNFDLEGKLHSTSDNDTVVGMLASEVESTYISGVHVLGTIESSGTQSNYFGGVIGRSTFTHLYNVESHVLINTLTEGPTGGIVGYAYETEFSNVINRGEIEALRAIEVGGIVGYAEISELNYVQNYGYIRGSSLVGGIVGYAIRTDIEVAINYGDVRTQTYHAGGIGGLISYVSEPLGVSSRILSFLVNYGEITSNLNDPTVRLGSIFAKMDFEIYDENDYIIIRDWIDFIGGIPLVSTIEDTANVYEFRIIFDGFRVTGSEYTLDKSSPNKGQVVVVNEFIMLDLNLLDSIEEAINDTSYSLKASLEEGVIVIDLVQYYYFTQGKINGPLSYEMFVANTTIFVTLPSISFVIPLMDDFAEIVDWDFTTMVGWNTQRDDSGTLYIPNDEVEYVRGVAFVRVYATDDIVPEDDNDLIDEEDDDEDEPLPETADRPFSVYIYLFLGIGCILIRKWK
jgi:hypothetical protein